MPQGYGTPVQNTRPTPYRTRQDLGYVPARAPVSGGSDGGGGSGPGIIISGGPSGPIITSGRVQVKSVSTTTYTLTADDLYFFINFTNAAGCVVTVPTDLTGAWSLTSIQPVFALHQAAAGKVSVVGAATVTVNTLAIFHPRTYGQFAVLQLIETAANTYTLFGAQDPI